MRLDVKRELFARSERVKSIDFHPQERKHFPELNKHMLVCLGAKEAVWTDGLCSQASSHNSRTLRLL